MIDLTQLPAPQVVETLAFDTVFAERKAALVAHWPPEQQDAVRRTLELESEPLTKLLRENAYRELVWRQRVNEAARATLLAYATGTDLDNKAADYGVARLLVTPADPDANPPVEAVWEDDARLRYRCQMALEGLSVAGSRGAYLFHTLSASPHVLDASIDSPAPGVVRVHLLDARGDGVPDAALLARVASALSADTVRPLCDTVDVRAGAPLPFAVVARVEFGDGGAAATGGLDGARRRLETMLATRRRLGGTVPRSALYAALQIEGVARVTLDQPAADIDCAIGHYPHCTAIELRA